MAEIHSLFGDELNEDGSNPEIIKELEEILDRAKRGDVLCFAIAFLDAAGVANSSVSGSAGRTAALGGAVSMMNHRYYSKWEDK